VEANGPLFDNLGPPEAFYPFASFRADGTPDTDSGGDFIAEDEYEDGCHILEAFFDMGEYDNEEDKLRWMRTILLSKCHVIGAEEKSRLDLI
jgi:hypothetical protein